MYSAIIKDSEHMKPPTAAAAAKRKQSERRSPEELPELQQHDTAARAIARADPEVRYKEQEHDTAARAIARADPEVRCKEQEHDTAARAIARAIARAKPEVRQRERIYVKFLPLGCSVDETTGECIFGQPCGLWNKPCIHGCGYFHFSAVII